MAEFDDIYRVYRLVGPEGARIVLENSSWCDFSVFAVNIVPGPMGGMCLRFLFDNGLTASVLPIPADVAGEPSNYEVAVLRDGQFFYPTSVFENDEPLRCSRSSALIALYRIKQWRDA